MHDSGANDARLTELALRAGQGDRAALEAFTRETQGDVWRFVVYLGDAWRGDDLTQETYARALRSLPGFAGQSAARTWLLSIARRVVADHLRAERAAPSTSSTDVATWARARTPGAGVGFEELVETNVLLAALPPHRREALVRTQLLGLPYQEVAAVCGCALGTVRSRVWRAREDLIDWAHERRDAAG